MKNRVRAAFAIQKAMYCAVYLLVVIICACASQPNSRGMHEFKLVGGHFYGPGPIVPDTALPVGFLRNIHFDIRSFKGYADFLNNGGENAVLSDGKTEINQNIDAGILEIGGGDNTVLLVAVKGGPNKGRERYFLSKEYAMEWEVDLALDPGFAEGIVRVDRFRLTTGLIQIANSLQTEKGIPNGYDQAGTLVSGHYLAGRVGDFDQDGYMDGIVVAAPRVPLESQMLPGSPVGNKRGFVTDVEIPAHLACELTLRGILQFERVVKALMQKGDVAQVRALLNEIEVRIDAAQSNMDRALVKGAWGLKKTKQANFQISDRMKSLKTLNLISQSLVENYPIHNGKFTDADFDSAQRMFSLADHIVTRVEKTNRKTDRHLPRVSHL